MNWLKFANAGLLATLLFAVSVVSLVSVPEAATSAAADAANACPLTEQAVMPASCPHVTEDATTTASHESGTIPVDDAQAAPQPPIAEDAARTESYAPPAEIDPPSVPYVPTTRYYTLTATEKKIEYAPGKTFTAWVYNGNIPGPIIRAYVGDTIKVTLINNSKRPHSFNPHILEYDPTIDDGTSLSPGSIVQPGQSYTYTFYATRPGAGVYHCHVDNDRYELSVHIQQGMQGAVIIEDPANPLPPAKEYLVMLDEVYNSPTKTMWHGCSYCAGSAKHFAMNGRQYPLPQALNLATGVIENPTAQAGQPVRFYVANLGNDLHSFHMHMLALKVRDVANGGTTQYVSGDNLGMMQGDMRVFETNAKLPGKYFYHCHMEEHSEMGMKGLVTVTP